MAPETEPALLSGLDIASNPKLLLPRRSTQGRLIAEPMSPKQIAHRSRPLAALLKKKHWTEHELNGLFAKERDGRKVILPIWREITDRELLKYSPAFADRIAMISKRDSVGDIVRNLKELLS